MKYDNSPSIVEYQVDSIAKRKGGSPFLFMIEHSIHDRREVH